MANPKLTANRWDGVCEEGVCEEALHTSWAARECVVGRDSTLWLKR